MDNKGVQSMCSERKNSERDQTKVEKPENDSDFASKRFSIFVLGAGFSKAAGLPLASELWNEIRERGLQKTGRASNFKDDLDEYIEYRKLCDGIDLTYEQVDFEDFMAFLDVEHYLWLRGGDTWSEHGNEAQIVVKTLIGEILTRSTPSKDNIPDLYLKFAQMLKPRDLVLTFNYDVLLERALEVTGVKFRLFPWRHKVDPKYPDRLEVDSRDEVIVMKLHGSVDWFDRTQYDYLEKDRIAQGFEQKTHNIIFKNPEDFRAYPLIEGPHNADDPLHPICRIQDIERLYRRGILFHETPFLLNPSPAKLIYIKDYRNFWEGLGRVGALNFRMAIIGFSLPSQDEYARQVIYRLVKNYQTAYWEEGIVEHKKTPLILVDLRKSPEEVQEFRKRYAFVDWNRAKMHLDGFNEDVVSLLNSS